jgi:transposase-like protein
MGSKRSKGAGVSGNLRQQLAHIRASEKSGGSLKDYAGRHGLSLQSLYQAKKAARQQGLLPPHRIGPSHARAPKKELAPARFTEALMVPPRSSSNPAWRIRLASGDVLESDSALPPEELVQVIRALRGDS